MKRRKKYLFPILYYVVPAVLLLGTFGSWLLWSNLDSRRIEERFNENVEEVTRQITATVDKAGIILHGGAGLFAASEHVTREEWRTFVGLQEMTLEHPGAVHMSFLRHVPRDQLSEYQESVRAEGFPDFAVWPAGQRNEYVPVDYIEPLDDFGRGAFGYDNLAELARRTAIERARDDSKIAMSGMARLIPEERGDAGRGFVVFAPVYREGLPPEDIEERRSNLYGFLSVSYRIDDMMKGIFPELPRYLDFDLFDGEDTSPASLMFSTSVRRSDADRRYEPSTSSRETLDLYGHQWTIVFRTTQAFDVANRRWTPLVIWVGGLVVIVLVVLLFRSQEKTVERARSIAARLTRSLKESEERFRLITENIRDVVWLVSGDNTQVLYVSPSYEEVYGRPRDTLYEDPRAFLDVVHPEDAEEVWPAFDSYAAGGEFDQVYRIVNPDGETRWVDVEIIAVRDMEEVTVGHVGRAADITPIKQAEQERVKREAADQANEAKSAFLAAMSHEIRTPLNAILGFAQVLERDAALGPTQTEHVQTISRSGRHLLNLINDILDLSRIESGQLHVSMNDFSLHDLLDDLHMMFRSRAEAQGLQLIVERQDAVPRYVHGDEGKLRQILVNLLGNAVKFTRTGGVAVRIRAIRHEEDRGEQEPLHLQVEVEDTGPGISEEDQEHIFESFRQSDEGLKAGGTGLGLAISRRLVEMMGGTISVESTVGTGSLFRCSVPITPVAEMEEQVTPEIRRVIGLSADTEPVRILVVDDQKENRDVIRLLLEPVGFLIREADNGEEALSVFEEWAPRAILMDLRMPVMDGYEATRRIRSSRVGRDTPIIAVTASAFEDDERAILATGVDGYLRKPFRAEELFDVLGRILNLVYLFEESETTSPQRSSAWELSSEDLESLPAVLVSEMRQSVDDGEMIRFKELLSEVHRVDPDLAFKLRTLADQYDYEKLTRILG